MHEIERVAAILRPSEIMLEWINSHQPEEEPLQLEDVQTDCTVVLLPAFEDEEDAETYLNQIYGEIFINELSSWNDDESTWPQERSIDVFLDWFDIEFHSMVYDCTDITPSPHTHRGTETLQ